MVRVVSGPPETVSAGTARVEIELPPGLAADRVRVLAAGHDVTSLFHQQENGSLSGVITDLPLGTSRIEVAGSHALSSIEVTNHPASGPIFSGPQQEPFFCATEEHRRRARLGDVLDGHCSMETRVDFLYLSKASGALEPYDDAVRADDVAQTTTMDGRTVSAIFRWERGTLNRFIYSIAVLSPTGQDSDKPDLTAWNRRLIYNFQGGVGVGHYQGEPSTSAMLPLEYLRLGYAVAYSTGTHTAVHYDLEVGGETALMVKSRFVTVYDKPDYTIGVGGSGGGLQQYLYAQNHPGLLDAGVPQVSYPDMITQSIHVGDCELLERWMDAEVRRDPASKWAKWSNRSWVQGLHASDTEKNPYNGGEPGLTECINGWRGLSPLIMNPHYGRAPGITAEEQRRTVWTHYEDVVQIYGRDAKGWARTNWDNEGVQYGLKALKDGLITPEEFLDLNARAGGWKHPSEMIQEGRPFIESDPDWDPYSARNMNLSPDDSGTPPAPRTAGDLNAMRAAYERGLVFTGGAEIPFIDWRPYMESILDMHNTRQSFVTRQRMRDHDGHADNMVIWFTDFDRKRAAYNQTLMAFEVLDEWMRNLSTYPERGVAGNRPKRAVDSCFDVEGKLIYAGEDAWDGILDDRTPGPCTQRFPIFETSRTIAGGPLTGDVFKCVLQRVDVAVARGMYAPWQPDAEQQARLEEIFPTGVCDYERGDAGRP